MSFDPGRAIRLGALICIGFLGISHQVAALTIIGDGGDLVAAVANAPNGEVIRIDSNQTFVGVLSWQNKFLTIEAGAGFSPTLRGTDYTPTMVLGSPVFTQIQGSAGTGGLIRGLKIVPGDNHPDVGLPYRSILISANSTRYADLTFEQNEIVGGTQFSGTGNFTVNARFTKNVFKQDVSFSGTGDLRFDVTATGNRFESLVAFGGTGRSSGNAVLTGNYFLRTNTLPQPSLSVSPISDASVTLLAVNNVMSGPNELGIHLDAPPTAHASGRFVNNTVVGFQTGIIVVDSATASFENMLLKNGDDISSFFSAGSSIKNSLISDGTFAGVNGNFAGVPSLGPMLELLPGSIGIDAANNSAANLPVKDILGVTRILDGNNDGIPRVDVGAYERVPEPSTALIFVTLALMLDIPRRRGRELLSS